jgi:transcriptional regulator with XRE-family HTH domain
MTEQEQSIVNNIADKLQIIIRKENLNILKLSQLLKIDKQPLYRIMKREHIPNTSFLEAIANYLKCSIVELIDDKFFLDIFVYNNFDFNKNNYKKYRVYLRDSNFTEIATNDFFGIAQSTLLKIFSKVESISSDGVFLISDKDNLTEIDILSVGSNLIIAMVNNKEKRLSHEEINVFAKLYKTVPILPIEEYGKLLIN